MKIKHILMAMTLMVAGNAAAQKLLTLEDVMWSGSNYYNLMPENKYTAWWGNQAVETTADEVRDLKTGKTIVTVEQVNKCFPEKIAFSGHNFSFPLAQRTCGDADQRTAKSHAEFPHRSGTSGCHSAQRCCGT